MTYRAPVIVLGMQRSGTTMVAEILNRAGLFVGWRQDPNQEAFFFQLLNVWLFQAAGGSRGRPSAIDDLLSDPALREISREYLSYLVGSPKALSYLGPTKYPRYRDLRRIDFAWGWKDPSTTFTLPIWLDIFPDARVVHVTRHGVDVAASVVRNRQSQLEEDSAQYRKLKWVFPIRPKRSGFVDITRASSIESAFDIWEEYLVRGRQMTSTLGSRALEIRFEDLATDPTRIVEQLAEFCCLPLSASRRDELAGHFRPERAFAYMARPDLLAFASVRQARLHGYEAAPAPAATALKDATGP